ncbi:MAG: pyridoxal phosphate-dependent aminotransferase [Methanocorpusculum sp.]|uniref:pyridoxal phosphate-dependent aminotransferase n=1 Tax=Methanocorpusculum sp. TaxID=2058474 RepID=UPI002725A263|nr:pyridoxal phosphate-dependent aminotransferase [Methanocorpusculum sp.]MDO9523884.1 pyridoxal phosphate-dependent aminotransferase [Methanocorpusculum sp.]
MTDFASRVKAIDISGIRKMFESAAPGSINMGLGQPDFDTPDNIKNAAVKAIAEGKTGYTNNAGIDELRAAVARKLKSENGLSYGPGDILITAGGSGALHAAIFSLVENGQKVVFNNPGFVSYGSLTTLAGGIPDPVALKPDLHLDVEALKEHFSDKNTKVMVLNSPANPTGAVETKETIRAVVESAADYGVTVLSDEVYEKFCYGNTEFVSAGTFGDNVVTINAASKTYAMTGWRIGFMAASREIIDQAVKIQQYSLACPTSIAQYAALEAYTGDQSSIGVMKKEYEARRNLLISGLREMGISVDMPEGAFYAFPKLELDTVMKIVAAGVIITPGGAFGSKGVGYARMSYATSQENIKIALDRIRTVVA